MKKDREKLLTRGGKFGNIDKLSRESVGDKSREEKDLKKSR